MYTSKIYNKICKPKTISPTTKITNNKAKKKIKLNQPILAIKGNKKQLKPKQQQSQMDSSRATP